MSVTVRCEICGDTYSSNDVDRALAWSEAHPHRADRETEEWPLQAEMDLRDAEAEDAYREFVNDHVREA